MTLDLSPLSRAVSRFEEAVEVYQRDPSQTLIRDGLIQRFEFTYEISHKILERYLEATSASPQQFDRMPFADLIRVANDEPTPWMLSRASSAFWRRCAICATKFQRGQPSEYPGYRYRG
jgi:hypothetical protein